MLKEGFGLEEIKNLTLRQISSIISLSFYNKAQEDIGTAIMIRNAYHAEEKGFKDFIYKLEEG